MPSQPSSASPSSHPPPSSASAAPHARGDSPRATSRDLRKAAKARVGKSIRGKWTLDALLGVGGMASVYAATHRNGSRAALKILHPELAADDGLRARFVREGYVANRVDHPGRVAVLDDDVTEQGAPFLVMELLDGQTLRQRLKREDCLPPAEALWIAAEVLDTLDPFHRQRVVHRDLKPGNIFLSRANAELEVKLLDFGISKIRHSHSVVTQDQSVIGTPFYMSPEQAEGEVQDIDHRTDIFSLGVIAYLSLSGRLPFSAPTTPGVLFQVCYKEPRPITEVVPGMPRRVHEVLSRALAKDKEQRYGRVDEFTTDLSLALYGAKVSAPTVPNIPVRALDSDTEQTPISRVGTPSYVTLEPSALHTWDGESSQDSGARGITGPGLPVGEARRFPALPGTGEQSGAAPDEGEDDLELRATVPATAGMRAPAPEVKGPLPSGARSDQAPLHPLVPVEEPASGSRPLSDAGDELRETPPAPGEDAAPEASVAPAPAEPAASAPEVPAAPLPVPEPNYGAPEDSAPSTLTQAVGQRAELELPDPVGPPRRWARVAVVALSAAVVLGGAGAVALLVGTEEPTATLVSAGGAAVDAPDAGSAEVRMRLKLTPESARVFVDGELRTDNPLVLPRSGATHRLRVEADGYVARVFSLPATDNREVLVVLTPAEPAEADQAKSKRAEPDAKPRRAERRTPRRSAPSPRSAQTPPKKSAPAADKPRDKAPAPRPAPPDRRNQVDPLAEPDKPSPRPPRPRPSKPKKDEAYLYDDI